MQDAYDKQTLILWLNNNIYQCFKELLNANEIYLSTLRKNVRIKSYSGPYFPAFGMNTERYSGKIQIRITPNTDTFYAVVILQTLFF